MTATPTEFHMIAAQPHRGVLRVRGQDARTWLENLISNDLAVAADGERVATQAALLSPQGKILFDLMIVDLGDHLLVETSRAQLTALAQRLTLYKLRAPVVIEPAPSVNVFVGPIAPLVNPGAAPIIARDGRSRSIGSRIYVDGALTEIVGAREAYTAHRVALGVPEAGADYTLGQIFPHDANFDVTGGVSFSKGCFIGQEVVARMQNKSVVRKRVVRVSGAALATGSEIVAGAQPLGAIGTVAGDQALAMLRLDRVVEALDAGTSIVSQGVAISIDADAVAQYRKAVAERPPQPEF